MSLEMLSRLTLRPISRAYGWLLNLSAPVPAFCSTEGVSWIRRLEDNWTTIRAELDQVRQNGDIPALYEVIPGENMVPNQGWKTLWLCFFAQQLKENCELCPQTTKVLSTLPGLVTAYFSVLGPGVHLPPHRGTFSGVLRCHLGLDIPDEERCAIKVSGETRHWHNGGTLYFDDTNVHEAWNHSDQERVVLLIDVKRPLPWYVRWLNEVMLFAVCRVIMPVIIKTEKMTVKKRDPEPNAVQHPA